MVLFFESLTGGVGDDEETNIFSIFNINIYWVR